MCIGNSSSTDRSQTLTAYGALDKSIGNLQNTGTALTDSGASSTGAATKYYSDILSGDPNRVAAAQAPQAAQGQEQGSQLLKQIANFGNRSGGNNQTIQNFGSTLRGNLIKGAGDARGAAAGNLANIGGQQTGQGVGATEGAASAASSLLSGSTTARQLSATLHANAVQNWSNLIQSVASGTGVTGATGSWAPS
jgi:hypothetical protein